MMRETNQKKWNMKQIFFFIEFIAANDITEEKNSQRKQNKWI